MKKYFLLFLALGALTFTDCTKSSGSSGDDDGTELPGGDQQENPGGDQPENPGGDQPENPGGDQPENPGGDQPEKPGNQDPEIPDYQGPDDDLSDSMENLFPDAVFRAYLLETFDTDHNGKITKKEAAAVRMIDVTKAQYGTADSEKIASLQGLEQFPYLQTLLCANNKLERLDVIRCTYLKELNCSNNKLTSLTLSSNPYLTSLTCDYNDLTTLNVASNTALQKLSFMFCSVSAIDVSKNKALTDFWCSFNSLSVLDVSENTALRTLRCNGNKLTGLDLYYNTELVSLWCQSNQIASLNVVNTNLGNSTDETPLNCISNPLGELHLKYGWNIKNIYPYKNPSFIPPTTNIIFH